MMRAQTGGGARALLRRLDHVSQWAVQRFLIKLATIGIFAGFFVKRPAQPLGRSDGVHGDLRADARAENCHRRGVRGSRRSLCVPYTGPANSLSILYASGAFSRETWFAGPTLSPPPPAAPRDEAQLIMQINAATPIAMKRYSTSTI
jgi:hypothetical protein